MIQDAEMQHEVRVNGVQSVQVYENRDAKNKRSYDVVVRGGQLVFIYNEDAAEWIGEMLDDKTEGVYGEIGYNRDFLDTHLETGEFTIKDKRIEREVRSRLEKIKKINHEKQLKKVEEDISILPSLEEEKARLEEKIAKAKEQHELAKSRVMPSLETKIEGKTIPPMQVMKGPEKEPDGQHAASS
jgi:hypothetical protein